jgi:hypothetical protein
MRWGSFFHSPALVDGDRGRDKDREQEGGVGTGTEERGEAGGEQGGGAGGAGGDRQGSDGGAARHDQGKGSTPHEQGKANKPVADLWKRFPEQAKDQGGREGRSVGVGGGRGLRVFMSPTVTYSPRTSVGMGGGGGSMGGPAGSKDEPAVEGHVVGFSTMVSEARPR